MFKPNIKRKIYISIAAGMLMIILVLLLSDRIYTLVQQSHERMKEYTQREVAISKSLTILYRNIGYGGFIHNLKNLVIRRDLNRYEDVIEYNIFELTEQLGILEGLVNTEKDLAALQELHLTFDDYTEKYGLAKEMVLANKTTSEIDAMIKVSDLKALASLDALSSSIRKRADRVEKEILINNIGTLNVIQLASLIMCIFIIILISLIILYLKREFKNNIQLYREKEKAEASNDAKSQFLSSMSHELRTPLNAILGFSQLIKMDAKDDVTEGNSEEIINAGKHLLELIDQILDLSKIESGAIPLSIDSYRIIDLLNDCLMTIMPIADKHEIKIDKKFDPLLTHIIDVDIVRFRQIVFNLLSNAIKYNNKNGKVIIECQPVDENILCVSITDTGKGLTPEQQSHLFKPFDRAGAENLDVAGTGLGLVICKNLIEEMNGTIGFESDKGKGSRFWIQIPFS
ncbi:MAG: HAMP domain-containing histidine kinase [Sulfuriflexus sp.]|nr:HAMP domain-containing histidine kinase [Sulfuriflexus sp.]